MNISLYKNQIALVQTRVPLESVS